MNFSTTLAIISSDKESKEMIQDLIKAGHDQAIKNLASKKAEEIQKITGGIGLPPNFKFPFQ